MGYQPSDQGDQYTIISGGTSITVVSDSPVTFQKLVIGGTYVGTLAIYDSPTAAGTAAGNLITTVPLPTTNLYRTVDYQIKLKNGLTYEATGTPVLTLTFSK